MINLEGAMHVSDKIGYVYEGNWGFNKIDGYNTGGIMLKRLTDGTTCHDVVKWAHARNLIEVSTSQAQMVKLMEEAGELASGIARDQRDIISDSIGDCAVVLIILAEQCGLDFADCVAQAYNEIKDRRGIMRDGFFVKEGD